jgi:hypothetical protein
MPLSAASEARPATSCRNPWRHHLECSGDFIGIATTVPAPADYQEVVLAAIRVEDAPEEMSGDEAKAADRRAGKVGKHLSPQKREGDHAAFVDSLSRSGLYRNPRVTWTRCASSIC